MPYWVVSTYFPLNVETMIEDTKKVEKIVGKDSSGAGSGFGGRDVDWTFDNKKDAEDARDKLIAAGYQGSMNRYTDS